MGSTFACQDLQYFINFQNNSTPWNDIFQDFHDHSKPVYGTDVGFKHKFYNINNAKTF